MRVGTAAPRRAALASETLALPRAGERREALRLLLVALRQDPALAAEYEAIKRRLADEHPTDVGAYTAGKREFVGAVLANAGLQFGRR